LLWEEQEIMPRKRKTKRERGSTTQLRPGSSEVKTTQKVSRAGEDEEQETVKVEEEEEEGYYEEANELGLPWEVWVAVLDFLPCADLAQFSQTCRLFHAIADMYAPQLYASPTRWMC
jgi:hypothetical protein